MTSTVGMGGHFTCLGNNVLTGFPVSPGGPLSPGVPGGPSIPYSQQHNVHTYIRTYVLIEKLIIKTDRSHYYVQWYTYIIIHVTLTSRKVG